MKKDTETEFKKLLLERYGIGEEIYSLALEAEREAAGSLEKIDRIKEFNTLKVLSAFRKEEISDRHFAGTTGYGYDDIGRDAIDKVFANAFGAEDAIVRPQIASGTHTLAITLFGLLRPGDELLAVTGKPYDTLEEVIGIRPGVGSLAEYGVKYSQVDLLPGGVPDLKAIHNAVNENTKVAEIQRSRGYAERKAYTVDEISGIVKAVKSKNPNTIVFVDNCYGEFTGIEEPTQVGADIMAGSLIKNPGGGLAKSGGYIAGRKQYVEMCSYRVTCPGAGREIGASVGTNRDILQGFYLAPQIVAESLKGAVFTASLFEKLGFETSPLKDEPRGDIVQTIKFGTQEGLTTFCGAVQAAAPIDSFVVPEAWDMPGYDVPVIMAAGAFVQGSSIELSADGPMKPPYIAFMQGGLSYANVKLASMLAAERLLKLKNNK